MPPPARPNGCSIQRSTKTASDIPANLGWLHRGVAYWRNGDDERIVILTAFAQMIALDAKTGKPVPIVRHRWPDRSRRRACAGRSVRNYYTMTSPPVIVRGVIVVGSSGDGSGGAKRPSPPGDVRGFDVGTGRLLVDLPHRARRARSPAPRPGRRIVEGGRQRQCLGADERGRGARLRLSAGEHADQRLLWRPSAGRWALWREPRLPRCRDRQEGLALPARASRAVGLRPAGRAGPDRHHRRRESRSRRSRRSPSRLLSMCSIASPASRYGRSRSSRCRPPAYPASVRRRRSRFRRKPAPFDIQGARDEDLIALTPELHKEAIDIAKAYDRGGLFTPPIAARHHRRCPAMPAARAGRVPRSIRKPARSMSGRSACPLRSFASRQPWQRHLRLHRRFRNICRGRAGCRCSSRRSAACVAIDMNTGEHRWRIPVGRSAAMPSISKLGISGAIWDFRHAQLGAADQDGHGRRADGILQRRRFVRRGQSADSAISTIAIRICGSTTRPHGEMLAEIDLPANATGAPMTYMAGGKQFIVFPGRRRAAGGGADRGFAVASIRNAAAL